MAERALVWGKKNPTAKPAQKQEKVSFDAGVHAPGWAIFHYFYHILLFYFSNFRYKYIRNYNTN